MKSKLYILTTIIFFLSILAIAQTPVLVKDINPGNISSNIGLSGIQMNGGFVFTAETAANGRELWFTDATTGGTVLIKDIFAGSGSSYPGDFYLLGGTLFFSANDNINGKELWKTDGTNGGTQIVKDISPGSASGFFQNCCGPFSFGVVWEQNGTIFFSANNQSVFGIDDVELWKSDGTAAGTVRVADINPGNGASYPSYFVPFNNMAYFIANNGINGRELWKTDGSTGGTQLVKDIKPGGSSGFTQNCCGDFGLYNVWEKNGSFYFQACSYSGTGGDDMELWKTDGTTSGTVRLADINPGNAPSNPSYFTPFVNDLYFIANNGTNGRELWKTDGTTSGTQLVKDIKPGALSGFTQNCCGDFGLYKAWEKNGSLYFVACSFSGFGGDDVELWKSDGSTAGTIRVADINSGNGPSYPQAFFEFGGNLFFSAETPALGRELYKTDGTNAGTVLVKDIFPGTGGGLEYSLTNIIWYGNTFYFTAYQLSSTDYELWKTDGTTNGTVKVLDIYPGTGGAYPGYFTLLSNDNLIFLATDNTNANELWKLYLPGVTGIEENAAPGILSVYPNPNNGDGINIVFPSQNKSELLLTDITGKKILTKMFPERMSPNSTYVPLPGLEQGTYILFMKDGKNEKWYKKIEVVK